VARLEPGVRTLLPACFALRLAAPGRLDELRPTAVPRPACADDEVVIRVRSTGLNLRDVLRGLGMIDADSAAGANGSGFGFEAAGLIDEVGSGATGLAVGDRVLAVLADGALASHLAVPARLVRELPPGMDFADAATLPLAMLTAMHALECVGHIRSGQHVLIHAAAGGVGQAAVQVARRAGATVIATASPAKWEHLRRAGVAHIASSRDLRFLDTVRAATAGEGADLVLNALNGAFIPASLDACRHGGVFVEIGSLGAWTPDQVAAYRPDIRYVRFDLRDVADRDPDGFARLLDELMQRMADGAIAALPRTEFPIERTADAFRFMAQARQVGKVVVTQQADRDRPRLRADAAYVIAGGLGGLGSAVAEWAAAAGATRIFLLGRHAASPATAADAVVQTLACDITDRAAVDRVFATLRQDGIRVAGVMHLAGALEDGLLASVTVDSIRRVLAPKLAGAWNLHEATADLDLDFFTLFSSAAALFGARGQGAYAAGNAFLDALAQYRRSQGLVGLSINWGPWAEVGMAARLDARARARLDALGLRSLQPALALAALGEALHEQGQIALIAADWPRLAVALGPSGGALLDRLAVPGAPEAVPDFASLPAAERLARLRVLVLREVRAVLALAPDHAVSSDEKLFEIGLDSLLAIELRNRLERHLGRRLRATLLFNYPTVAALVEYLGQAIDAPAAAAVEAPSSDEDALRDDIAGLSDAEAERQLLEELARLQVAST